MMRKVDLIRKNMVQSVKNERNILAMANNPFVVSGWALRCGVAAAVRVGRLWQSESGGCGRAAVG